MQGWKQDVAHRRIVGLDELQDLPVGEVVRLSYYSAHLGLRRFVGLYRPSPAPLERTQFPVIYLFRGHYSEWFYPGEDGSRAKHQPEGEAQAFPDLLQHKVASGRLPPCLLVLPDFGGDDRQGLTLAIDWAEPRLAEQGLFVGGGIGAFESGFRSELVPELDDALGLLNPRRIAIGFSLGGLNATVVALRNPGLFHAVAVYDGSFPYDPIRENDAILRHPLFDPIFGRPRDKARVKAHSPVWLARNLPSAQLKRMRFFLASGPEWAEPGDANFYRTAELLAALRDRGVENGCSSTVDDGHHDWYTADRFALNVLDEILGKEASLRGGSSG